MTATHTWQLTVKEPVSALDLLNTQLELPKAELKRLGAFGCIWWQAPDSKPRRLRRLKKILKAGEQLHCYYDPAILGEPIVPAICIDDQEDFSIWLKPRGMFSQGTKWGDANSISRFVEQNLNRPTWLVHRLDRMTAGLIILSHKKSLVDYFTKAFAEAVIDKTYIAVVQGAWLETPKIIEVMLDGKQARTEVMASHYSASLDSSLLELKIHSGRKHQIRRHLSESGHPIIGDRLYSETDNAASELDLQLVAQAIRFADPHDDTLCRYHLDEAQLSELLDDRYRPLVTELFCQKPAE